MSTTRFIAKNGLDNSNQTITNVADGFNVTDAATVGQLGTTTALLDGNGVISGMTIVPGSTSEKFTVNSGTYNKIGAGTVTYAGVTDQTVTDILTQNQTFIGLNTTTGLIVQQAGHFSPEQRRTHVVLGILIHTDNLTINSINNLPDVANLSLAQLNDFMEEFGPFNIHGNVISANGANLSIDKSFGELFKRGVNFVSNPNDPHTKDMSALVAPNTMRMRMSNGIEGLNTNVISIQYESAPGVLTPISSGKYGVFRVVLFPSNLIRIQYPQFIYNNMTEAQEGINTENYQLESNIAANGLIRAYIILKGNATSLLSTADAKILQADKFGYNISGGGGGGTTTLQAAYDNSIQPEIVTNATLGAVSLKRGSTTDTDNVLEIINGAGDVTGNVKGNGSAGFTELKIDNTLTVDSTVGGVVTFDSTGNDAVAYEIKQQTVNKLVIYQDGSASLPDCLLTDITDDKDISTKEYVDQFGDVLTPHVADLTIHRVQNDALTTTQNLWSAQKIQDELDTKSDTTHTHTLDFLSDVSISSPTDGQVLTYNSATGDWINGAGGGGSTNGGGSGAGTVQTTHLTNANGTIDFGAGATQLPYYSFFSVSSDVKSLDRIRFYVDSVSTNITFSVALMEFNGTDWVRLTANNNVVVTTAGFQDVSIAGINLVSGNKYAIGIIRKTTTAGTCNIAYSQALLSSSIGFNGASQSSTYEITATETTKTAADVVLWFMLYSSDGGDFNSFTTTTKIANYTAVRNNVILCNTSAGGFTITLPLASANKDKVIVIKKITNDSNVVLVDPQGSETIDGDLVKSVSEYRTAFTVISDGSNWWVM